MSDMFKIAKSGKPQTAKRTIGKFLPFKFMRINEELFIFMKQLEQSAVNDSKCELTSVANNGQVVNPETEANLNQNAQDVLDDNIMPEITPPELLPKPERHKTIMSKPVTTIGAINRSRVTQCSLAETNKLELMEENIELVYTEKDIMDPTAIWGPMVSTELLNKMGWQQAQSISYSREGVPYTIEASETNPIFAQKCQFLDTNGNEQVFYRIYEPMNENPEARIYNLGKMKQPNYIFGMEQLQRKSRLNGHARLERIIITTDYKTEACLSAYEDNALCIRDISSISITQIEELLLYAKKVIILYDPTEQDKINARKIALDYPSIFVTSLKPSDFGEKQPKNFSLQEFFNRYPSPEAVECVLNRARRAQFWKENRDKNGNITSYSFIQSYLTFFLELNGYVEMADPTSKDPTYIHIDGKLVEKIYAKDIRSFVKEWGENTGITIKILDSVLACKMLPTDSISNLTRIDNLDFNTATRTSQLFYFNNGWIEVTAENITLHPYNDLTGGCYAWKDTVIPHDYKEMEPQFTLQKDEEDNYYIDIAPEAPSKLLRVVKQMSRLYWRKKDEHGQELTEDEQREEKQNLFALCCAIGYLIHRFKSPSASYAMLFLDNVISRNPKDCNGRNGKSFLMEAIGKMNKGHYINMRDFERRSNKQFALANVTENTGMIILDECPEDYAFGNLFGKITGHLEIEKKGKDIVQIDAKKSPKFAIGSNFTLNKHDPSTEGRFCKIAVSDYFHVKTETNDYKKTHMIYDEFGQDLMGSDYSEEDWQYDINFMVECLRMYLSLPVADRRQASPTGQIKRREILSTIDDKFNEWAEEYFAPESGNLNRRIIKSSLPDIFKGETGCDMKQKSFTTNLKSFCELKGYEYNPNAKTNTKDGRIMVKDPESKKSVEYVFIQGPESQEKSKE